ncbi:MAG: ABC transporter ATP-binding protein [Actinomycetota bacterium]|nr:ABC transporter ATP-binding protein [Actinomycetota bacterium]
MYDLRRVTRSYGSGETTVDAVREIDLRIERGEFVAVSGPSGSGKTTLLQLLGALDRPTSGEVIFEGRDLATLKESELTRLRLGTIGFVFQQFNLIPTVSAAENIALALAPAGLPAAVRAERVRALLESVGLGPRGDHLPNALSGGEQQRVAIARALANDPDVLLADEPTGNLDSTTGDEIMSVLKELNRERNQTIVVITHDASVAAAAPRTVRLRDGSIVDGDAELELTGAAR